MRSHVQTPPGHAPVELRRKTPASGDPDKGDAAPAADTEQLRLALRDYRELAERLLSV